MITVIKIIVTIFMIIASILLFILWTFFGTLLLISLIIRLICLYTIALLNSFVSGNPLTQNYSKAIEDVLNMYVETFSKILSMPKLPWQSLEEKEKVNFRSLLPHEMNELKKSWYVTIIVFLSYISSIGLTLGYLLYQDNVDRDYLNKQISDQRTTLKDISKLNFRIGKLITSEGGYYSKGSKVFFKTYKPLVINHFYVKSKEQGNITFLVKNFKDSLMIEKKLNLPKGKTWYKIKLDLSLPKIGRYYIEFKGNINLWCNNEKFNYNAYWDNVIAITGSDESIKNYKNTAYYRYFYDWSYSLLVDNSK